MEGVKPTKAAVPTDRTRDDGHKLKHMKFYPTSRKKFPEKAVKYWNRMLRKMVESPSLEIVKTQLDTIPCNMLQPPLLKQQGCSRSAQEVPSSPCDSAWVGSRDHNFRSQV